MGRWFQRFVASGIHGEVSDATIRGYLRSASQLEEVWQQIDDNVDTLIGQGVAPWDAYARMGYALAFVRACRTNVVFIQELLKADAAADPESAGYLPRVTYEQALALSEHIEPFMEEAIKASTNPHYVPTFPFPFELGPRIQYPGQRLPLPHVQGFIAAAQETREWAAGLLAKYELALAGAKTPVPQPVTIHVEQMKSELSLGDFHLRTSVDMVGQISQGQATNELGAKAEDFLWEALESFFKVSQLVAFPGVPTRPRPAAHATRPPAQAHPHVEYAAPRPQPQPAIPAQPPTPPVPPGPDTSELLNQVIAVPDVSRKAPAQLSPEETALLNQVTTVPDAPPKAPVQPSPETSDLLNQVIVAPDVKREPPPQPSSEPSNLFNQVTGSPGPTRQPSAQPSSEAPGLLDEAVDDDETWKQGHK